MNSELRLIMLLCLAIDALHAQYRIDTIAGGGVPETPSALSIPVHNGTVAVGPAGEWYFTYLGAVYRSRDGGTVVHVAGKFSQTFSGDAGPATSAGLNPAGLALDAWGNLFIADAASNRVRRVDAQTGIISTVAGNGIPAFTGDGGPATDASLNTPRWLALDAAENLFIADSGNYRVRRVDAQTGAIKTIAGTFYLRAFRICPDALPGRTGRGRSGDAVYRGRP